MRKKDRFEAILEQIFERVLVVSSKTQLTLMLNEITQECNAGFKVTTTRSLLHIAKTTETVPRQMSKEFGTKINELIETILGNLKR